MASVRSVSIILALVLAAGSAQAACPKDLSALKYNAYLGQKEAQRAFGHMHLDGRCVPFDLVEAEYWLTRSVREHADKTAEALLTALPSTARRNWPGLVAAADTGDARAQYALSWILWKGHGQSKDTAGAIRWATRAAGKQSAIAYRVLADIHASQKQKILEMDALRCAARLGDPEAQFRLASKRLSEVRTSKDIPRSFVEANRPLLENAAAAGHAQAMQELGGLLVYAYKDPATINHGIDWIEKGVRFDRKVARLDHHGRIFMVSAEFGWGTIYHNYSMWNNPTLAFRLAKAYARRGFPAAMGFLGLLYGGLKGHPGYPRFDDPERAYAWYLLHQKWSRIWIGRLKASGLDAQIESLNQNIRSVEASIAKLHKKLPVNRVIRARALAAKLEDEFTRK
jgi:TPR repeat protein